MPTPFKIEVLSHGVRVSGLHLDITVQLKPFLEELTQRETEEIYDYRSDTTSYRTVIKKKYYVQTEDGKELFIHREHLDPFLEMLKTIGCTNYKLTHRKKYKPDEIEFKTIPTKVPRDYQQVIIDELVDENRTRNVCLSAGGGKTFCALKATEILKSRVLLMLLPKYFGIWEKAIEEDVLEGVHCELIKGSKSLRDLIDRAINGDPIGDVIFMSVTTYRGYIECLERYGTKGIGELGYAVPPYRFHETLGIGLQINDEIQDDPGVYYRVDTVSHMNKEIFLTATPYTGSDKLTEMIRVMMNERYDVTIPVADKYTHVVGVRYNDLGVQKKDYRGYKNAYSHVNYESSILKNKPRKDKYFNNVARVVNHYFKGEYQKGQKMVIYCATQKFITALTKYLKKEFPEYTINEYVSGVDRNTLKANDITVTTIKSCGAGVDIPNLKEALMLVATNSKKDSIQAMRRPRPLINYEGINPRFSYFICNQIPKHLGYAKNKRTFFIPFALTHVDRRIG